MDIRSRMDKRMYVHVMECYTAVGISELALHATIRINPTNIWQENQTQKDTYCTIPFIGIS